MKTYSLLPSNQHDTNNLGLYFESLYFTAQRIRCCLGQYQCNEKSAHVSQQCPHCSQWKSIGRKCSSILEACPVCVYTIVSK